jgi:CheY-like chemotaxis protein
VGDDVAAVDGPRILLVISDASMAHDLGSTLTSGGFVPITLGSGAAALEALPGSKFAAVVAAQLLPGMDGMALCKKIKESRPLPVILLASVTSPAGVTDVRKTSGADAVFPRSFNAEALLAELYKRTGSKPPAPEGLPDPPASTASAASPARGSGPSAARPPAAEKPAPGEKAPVTPRTGERVSRGPVPVRPATTVGVPTLPPVPIDPAWIFGQCVANSATGMLRLVLSGVERAIYFDGGRPVVATSNVPAELIGRMLIADGVLGPEELANFLALSAKSGVRIAELLVQKGVLTATDRLSIVQRQYTERVLACFAWAQAGIEFVPAPAPVEEIQINLPAGKILVEGMRRHYDATRLQAAVPADRVLTRIPNAERLLPELGFDDMEAFAFLAADGVQTIGTIASDEESRAVTLRALHAGICLNLLV